MATLPTRLKILEWGANESDRGTFLVDETSAAELRAQIDGEAWAKLVIDFDHQSEEGSGSFKESPRHHAGYGDLEVVEGDGVYLTGIEWTEAGREYALDYKDVSPSVAVNKENRVVGVSSVALVPNGALKGRTLFAALRNDLEVDPQTEEHDMDENEKKDEAKALETKGGKAAETSAAPPPGEAGDTPPDEEKKAELEAAEAQSAELRRQVEELTKALEDARAEIARLKEEKTPPSAKAEPEGKPGTLAAEPAATDVLEKKWLLRFAALEGKAVTLPESVVEKMSVKELEQHLAASKAGTLPTSSVLPRGAGQKSAGNLRGNGEGLALVAKYQGQGMSFERAWRTARTERPELF